MIAIFLLLLILEALPASAKEDVKISGRIGVGLEKIDDETNRDLFEIRLGVKTKRRKGIRAYVELKADENTRETRIHEAYADYKSPEENWRVRAGRGKKVIGWEYAFSANEDLGIDKSLVYRYLEERAIVGRDYLASVTYLSGGKVEESAADDAKTEDEAVPEEDSNAGPIHPPAGEISESDTDAGIPNSLVDPTHRWRLGLSGHYDESNNSAGIASAIFTPGDHFQYGAWLAYSMNRATYTQVNTYQAVLSGMYEKPWIRVDVEGFAGTDPFRSLMENDYGSGRKVPFAAAKGEVGLFLGKWSPYLVWTTLWKDLEHAGDRGEEATLGLKVFAMKRLTFAAEYSRIRNVVSFDPTTEPTQNQRIAVLGRYFF